MLELSCIYEKLQQLEEVPADVLMLCLLLRRRREKPTNYKPVVLTLASGKTVEYLVLESISNHVNNTRTNTGTASTDLVRVIHA